MKITPDALSLNGGCLGGQNFEFLPLIPKHVRESKSKKGVWSCRCYSGQIRVPVKLGHPDLLLYAFYIYRSINPKTSTVQVEQLSDLSTQSMFFHDFLSFPREIEHTQICWCVAFIKF